MIKDESRAEAQLLTTLNKEPESPALWRRKFAAVALVGLAFTAAACGESDPEGPNGPAQPSASSTAEAGPSAETIDSPEENDTPVKRETPVERTAPEGSVLFDNSGNVKVWQELPEPVNLDSQADRDAYEQQRTEVLSNLYNPLLANTKPNEPLPISKLIDQKAVEYASYNSDAAVEVINMPLSYFGGGGASIEQINNRLHDISTLLSQPIKMPVPEVAKQMDQYLENCLTPGSYLTEDRFNELLASGDTTTLFKELTSWCLSGEKETNPQIMYYDYLLSKLAPAHEGDTSFIPLEELDPGGEKAELFTSINDLISAQVNNPGDYYFGTIEDIYERERLEAGAFEPVRPNIYNSLKELRNDEYKNQLDFEPPMIKSAEVLNYAPLRVAEHEAAGIMGLSFLVEFSYGENDEEQTETHVMNVIAASAPVLNSKADGGIIGLFANGAYNIGE